ncbi:hypothetical protein AB8I92_003407 [Vibrio alginolyticus]|uniref:hypothetical protein n=1 Tax=Vibrio alginolyticus TaxID=663 RepID=UPI0006CA686E|nr:hypothetical protein [Vibrio alginolyticus]KPM92189.1 hypothetical protein AOR10_13380 [Vibrio alginolyticus]
MLLFAIRHLIVFELIKEKILGLASILITSFAATYYLSASYTFGVFTSAMFGIAYLYFMQRQQQQSVRRKEAQAKIRGFGYTNSISSQMERPSNASRSQSSPTLNEQNPFNFSEEEVQAFKLLGLPITSLNISEIKKAFHHKVRYYHPDINQNISTDESIITVSNLNTAKTLCINATKRKQNERL